MLALHTFKLYLILPFPRDVWNLNYYKEREYAKIVWWHFQCTQVHGKRFKSFNHCSVVISSVSFFPSKENGVLSLDYLTRDYGKQNLNMYFPCFRGVNLFSSSVSVGPRLVAMWTARCIKKVESLPHPSQTIQSSSGEVHSPRYVFPLKWLFLIYQGKWEQDVHRVSWSRVQILKWIFIGRELLDTGEFHVMQ